MPSGSSPAVPERAIDRSLLAQPPEVVAPELLGAVLVHDHPDGGRRSGRIVEVEAYLHEGDPGSHAARGPTRANATMFGGAGSLYVYFTYGMHWCANVVCGGDGEGAAVLVRALEPLEGAEAMAAARGPVVRSPRDLCSGPAKLAQALGIDGTHDGLDLLAGGPIRLVTGRGAPASVVRTTRIGLRRGAELALRWYDADDPNVSRR